MKGSAMNERKIEFHDDGLWAFAGDPCLPGWVKSVRDDESPEYERERRRFDRGDFHTRVSPTPSSSPRRLGVE
jgi:hypothetical protein